jgi:hypothetical protein
MHYEMIRITLHAKEIRKVVCEHCGQIYYYEFSRSGTGEGAIPLGVILRDYVHKRTRKWAQKRLDYKVKNEGDLVPCPKCNWVSQELVDQYRMSIMPEAGRIILYASIFLGLITLWMITLANVAKSLEDRTAFKIMSIVCVSINILMPLLYYGLKNALRNQINPNRDYPSRVNVPVGTPMSPLECKQNLCLSGEMCWSKKISHHIVLGV